MIILTGKGTILAVVVGCIVGTCIGAWRGYSNGYKNGYDNGYRWCYTSQVSDAAKLESPYTYFFGLDEFPEFTDVNDWEDKGWNVTSISDYIPMLCDELDPGCYTNIKLTKGSCSVTATVRNRGTEAAVLSDCSVYSISVYGDSMQWFEDSNDVNSLMGKDDIIALFGKPDNSDESGNSYSYWNLVGEGYPNTYNFIFIGDSLHEIEVKFYAIGD